MMKPININRLCGLLLLIFIAFFVMSCDKKQKTAEPDPLDSETASGELLWKSIAVQTDYTDYLFWPGHEGLQPGQAPHGSFHKVYINKTLEDGLPAGDRTAPYGSIIVKENYSRSEQLTGITVMAKVEGYHPEHGDWFWAKYGPDGRIDAEGKVGGCITCHEGMRDNDYVIIHPLDK